MSASVGIECGLSSGSHAFDPLVVYLSVCVVVAVALAVGSDLTEKLSLQQLDKMHIRHFYKLYIDNATRPIGPRNGPQYTDFTSTNLE